MTREVEPTVDPLAMAAPARRRGQDTPQPRQERHDAPVADRAPAPPAARMRQIDPSEGVAERTSATYELAKRHARDTSSSDGAATAEELYIPGWVRITYASRARRGWFLPAPTTLAGYGEHEKSAEKPTE